MTAIILYKSKRSGIVMTRQEWINTLSYNTEILDNVETPEEYFERWLSKGFFEEIIQDKEKLH